MESIIRQGVTIIKMPPKPDSREQSKSGVPGVWKTDGTLKLEVGYNGKRYYFGVQKSLEDADALRQLADKHIEEGTFLEWYKEVRENYVLTQGKNGVKGLSYRKSRNVYQLYIYHNNERFYIDIFNEVEDAALVRAEADRHIEDGTFYEWFHEFKFNKKRK